MTCDGRIIYKFRLRLNQSGDRFSEDLEFPRTETRASECKSTAFKLTPIPHKPRYSVNHMTVISLSKFFDP